MRVGIAAIARATGVTPQAKAVALLGAAGTAAAAKSRGAATDAVAAYEALSAEARRGRDLVLVGVYASLGDFAEARRRLAMQDGSPDHAMFAASLAADTGRWDELGAQVSPEPVLMASIWADALHAKLDPDRAARVLDTFCRR
jgi:hypothetical protein